MKTALELLGKVRDAQFISAEGHNITLPPSVFEDWLELVAQRAREEMKAAAEDVAVTPCSSYCMHEDHRGEREAAKRIRALPVKPK